MLKFHRTSILESSAQTVVNTVNTVGVMGKGLAAAYKKKYPEMFRKYKVICDANMLVAGSFWLWKGSDQWVLNFATKKHWRNPSKFDYIEAGLVEFREKYNELGIREIAFPRLGCGNGGLNWDEVKPMMVHYLRNLPIDIYIHDFEANIGKPEHHFVSHKCRFAGSFDDFVEDIVLLLKRSHGHLKPLYYSDELNLHVDSKKNVFRENGEQTLIADEEDLFRIWRTLKSSVLTRDALPETPYDNALPIFSLLSYLPYIRPVRVSDLHGKSQIALEMLRANNSLDLSNSDNIQDEFKWG
ncbi:macro domain-containing protein [Pseudovibrio sp. POLY-S9]|uniref:macro domain-containing protein n=1 Tax=Pseudovibrio sp. POLY-S9 TaxID=1576596 RepID=UPI0007097ADB|nr:macro domain-containing protein [Pseudovibrio sp. POLY-S9]